MLINTPPEIAKEYIERKYNLKATSKNESRKRLNHTYYLIGNETFVIHESAIANIYEYLKISTTGALWYLYILFGIFIFNKLLSFFLSYGIVR